MAHINRLLKGALISTAGVVGSLMLTKHFTKNKSLKHIPPFFDKPSPYLFAHRGGMFERPEQTKLAFDRAVEMQLDGFETDVRLTKDLQLVVFHDASLDRTTNGSGLVSEHTLNELKRLDAGYHFTDINGNHPYRSHSDARILSFDELLDLYPNHLVNVDLKDDPSQSLGAQAPQRMYEIIQQHHAEDRVLVTSFDDRQTRKFKQISQNQVAVGASQKEVTVGFLKCFSGLGETFKPMADTFQMPTQFKGINLTSSKFIQWLNHINVVPGFYGINNIDLMNDLYAKGVHTLVTDKPELAYRFKKMHNLLEK